MAKRDTRIEFLANRDNGRCGICHKSLDSELSKLVLFHWQKKQGGKNDIRRRSIDLSIDHIVPKCKFKWNYNIKHIGNSPANTQLTHRKCNLSKGNKCGLREWLKFIVNWFK